MRIYVYHVRKCGFCTSGARDWFKKYGLDWNDFLSNGVPVATFRALNDQYGNRVADAAEGKDG